MTRRDDCSVASSVLYLQEGIFVKSHWLTGKEGYQFQVNLDVCMFIPKKVCKAYIYQMSCFLFTKTESIVSSIAKEVSPWKFRVLFALLKKYR